MKTFGDRSTSWLIRTVTGVCGFFGRTTIRPIGRKSCARSTTSGGTATGRHSAKLGNYINGSHRIPADRLPSHSGQSPRTGRGLRSGRGRIEPSDRRAGGFPAISTFSTIRSKLWMPCGRPIASCSRAVAMRCDPFTNAPAMWRPWWARGRQIRGGAVVLAGPDEQGVPSKPYRLRIGVRLGKSG